MITKIKSQFRFTVREEVKKKLGLKVGDIVEVILKKGSQKGFFIAKIQKGNQIKIWNSIRRNLNLNINDKVILKIKKLSEIKRSQKILKEGKIDILALIPEKSRKGFPIRMISDGSKIIIWMDTPRGGIAKPLMIKRFVSLEFCKLLGLMQAEGQKAVFKGTGCPFLFSNKLPSLHRVVIDCLRELGISDDMIKLEIKIQKGTKQKIKNEVIKNFFSITQLRPGKIITKFVERSNRIFDERTSKFRTLNNKNIMFEIKIGRTLLFELIMNSILTIRSFLSNLPNFKRNTKILACNFLSGVIMGDGTTGIGVNRHKIFFQMWIEDPDILHLQECEKIFRTLGFRTSLKIDKEPPKLFIFCNWKLLCLIVFKNKMTKEHPFHWMKVLLAIKNMKQWRTFSRFIVFNKSLTSKEFGDKLGIKSERISLWLIRREKERLVKRVGLIDNFKVIWNLTRKGEKFRQLLIDVKQKVNELHEILGVNEFNEAREIIKNINGREVFHQDLMLKIFRWVLEDYRVISVSLNTSKNSGLFSKCSLSGLNISDNSLATFSLRS